MQETQETQVLSLDREDPPEKEMATHSSILIRRIPCTEEPGGWLIKSFALAGGFFTSSLPPRKPLCWQ